jgi:glycogen(starch) synthase
MADRSVFEGIPEHRFGFHTALLRRDLSAIRRLAVEVAALKRDFRADVVHINTSQPSILFHEKSTAGNAVATLVTVHEPPILNAGNSMLARLLRDADWVVGVSQAMLDDALVIVPEIADRCSVIHNAIDERSDAVVPLPTDAPEVFCVGRLVAEKGWDVAVRALANARESFPNISMTIVGDGPERSKLQQLSAELGIAESVSFVGWVPPDDVGELLRRAFAVLIPSRWREPFGLIALQAAEAGRPVIASRVGGLAEIVIDGVTGILVPPDDVFSLAGALRDLLAHPGKALRMGDAAREHKRAEFDYDKFVASYEQLYGRLGADRRSRGLGA